MEREYMCNNCGSGFSEIYTIEDSDVCLNCAGLVRVYEEILDGIASNIICFETQVLIPSYGDMYVLNGEYYSVEVDIDSLIQEVTEGRYRTSEELYDNNSDYFYFTQNYDVSTVLQEIIDQGYYYNHKSEKIQL